MHRPSAIILPLNPPSPERRPGFGPVSALGWLTIGCVALWCGMLAWFFGYFA